MVNTDKSNDAINDVTITIDEGYDMAVWSKLTNSNWYVLDTSSTPYIRIKTTFWGNTNPPKVDEGTRTVSVSVNAAGLKDGYYVSIPREISTMSVVSCEMDSNIC